MNRTERLKEKVIKAPLETCLERAKLITESFKNTEGESTVIRRAKGLEYILTNTTINIYPDELVVGNQSSKRKGAPIFPEFSAVESSFIDAKDKKELKEIFKYWEDKRVYEKALSLMSEEEILAQEAGVYTLSSYKLGIGHIIADYEKVLNIGFEGIRKEAEKKLSGLNKSNDIKEKTNFYQAIIITTQAVTKFAKRFSKLAFDLANIEKDNKRKKELEKIGEICQRVPEKGAKTFWEAIQSFWFTHLVMQIESNSLSYSPGRFDQYMYPFYANDVLNERITKEEVQELIECLWIKLNEICCLSNEIDPDTAVGQGMFQNLILGGQTKDGKDATNELSYICLEATKKLRVTQPSLSARFHPGSPEKFILKCCELIRTGIGFPAVFGDDANIMAMLNRGIKLEDARNYGIIGCVELGVPGKEYPWITTNFNLPKCLELTLNNGRCQLTGKQIGPKTGEFNEFTSFEKIINAFKEQIEYFVKLMVITDNNNNKVQAELVPLPYLSSIISNCIEKGKDINMGGAEYNFSGPCSVGISNTADSLAVIKKLVFEDKTVTFEKLVELLRANFEDNEPMRQMFKNRVPKYGNDEDYVDDIAHRIVNIWCDAVEKHKNFRGGWYQGGVYPVTAHIPLGKMVGATPEGRKAREPLAEGISPVQGMDKNGPTAAIKSVAKVDHIRLSAGTLLNQKINPVTINGEDGLRRLAVLIKTYFSLKGMHMQFNVVDKKMLQEAQVNPERYSNLIVRVAGYSAYFTMLKRDLQDEIISRTEQRL